MEKRIGMEQPQISDEHLLAQMAAGSTQALGQIVERHQDNVLSLAYRYTQNWPDAEDIAQETFIRVFRAAKKYKAQSGFRTWLYRIVVNLCMDHHRKNRPAVSLAIVTAEMASKTASDPLETDEIAALVQKAVSELPERQKMALILHRYENLTHARISETTGWSPSAVESLLVRAYGNLREKLAKIMENPD